MDLSSSSSSSLLLTLIPALTTIAFMAQSPNFSWITCIPYLLPMLLPFATQLPSWKRITELAGRWVTRTKPPMSFTSRLKLRLWHDEPNSLVRNFSTLLWEWNRLNKTANCQQLMEEGVHNYYDDELKDVTPPFFVDDANQRFWNVDRPTIHYTMWVDRTTDRDGCVQADINLRIELNSANANPNALVEHIDFIIDEAKRIRREQKRIQRVLVSTGGSGSGSSGSDEGDDSKSKGPAMMAYEFHTTSSFANFFCEEAEIVRGDLRHFLENKAAYLRTGRPWTYTVLNEGPPGVGKTKLVKAIAALTGYTLIIINLAHIKSAQMLYEAFHTTTLAGETVPHDKRLYYIPEVDTQVTDMLKLRKEAKDAKEAREAFDCSILVASASASASAVHPSESKGKDGKTAGATTPIVVDNRPTLGEILNVLDGVPERYGHILVLDTNHLATLDPALIRPGRVDRILSWKKLSATSVGRFLENYYGEPVADDADLPDRAMTAAELQSAVLSHPTLVDYVQYVRSKASQHISL